MKTKFDGKEWQVENKDNFFEYNVATPKGNISMFPSSIYIAQILLKINEMKTHHLTFYHNCIPCFRPKQECINEGISDIYIYSPYCSSIILVTSNVGPYSYEFSTINIKHDQIFMYLDTIQKTIENRVISVDDDIQALREAKETHAMLKHLLNKKGMIQELSNELEDFMTTKNHTEG